MENNEKIKVFSIGGNGLVGSRVAELLKEKYTFDNLSTANGVDITNPQTLDGIKNDTDHKIVLHLAAKTDVDGCEHDKSLADEGAAWRINVQGTKHVLDACRIGKKKIVYISTDFVFNGEKGEYSEGDIPNPVNWYGKTKLEGEKAVRESGLPFLIIRPAYPYRSPFPEKKDFVQAILTRLKNNETVQALTDHVFTPTFVDDFASALDVLLSTEQQGVFHIVGGQSLRPYDAAMMIAKTFMLDTSLVQTTSRSEFFRGRALRPFNLSMRNDKIQRLGISMRTFEDGLQEVKRQMSTPIESGSKGKSTS